MSEYKMPKLGADMEDAILIEWKVKEGERVQKGDIIAEIETVKGDIDVEVFEDGIIEKIFAQPGERLPVGTVLAFINNEESSPVKAAKEAPPMEEVEEKQPQIPVVLAEVPSKGLDSENRAQKDIPLKEEPEITPFLEDLPPQRRPMPPKPDRPIFRHNASPLARRIAKDLGIDLQQVIGTGEGGIIHKVDVESFAFSRKKNKEFAPTINEKPTSTKDRKTKMRSAIAAAMSRSNREIPHYYLETTIDMLTALNWVRKENEQRPVKKRLLAAVLLLKASALALRKVPQLNGYWIEGQFQSQARIHIGFAIPLRGEGLVIPAIHDIDKKSLDELMEALNDVALRARKGKLRSSELTDGTVTMTNIGDRGVEKVFGVIYPPQVAIIGFGKIIEKPWAENGLLGVRPQLTATLAADHRATDGRIGAKFLKTLNDYLQQPDKL